MSSVTIRYKAGNLHLCTEHSQADVEFCPHKETHTVMELRSSAALSEFNWSVERDPASIAGLRIFFAQISEEPALSRSTDQHILRRTAELLTRGSIKAVLCGVQTGVRNVVWSAARRRFHVVSGSGGDIPCLHHMRHKEIELEGDERRKFAEDLLRDTKDPTELLRLASIPARGDVAGKLAEWIQSGRVRIIECVAAAGGAGESSTEPTDRQKTPVRPQARGDAALAAAGAKTWVEIRLVDEDGKPVPNQKYTLKLPDGTARNGSLDEHGRARVEQIDPGTCQVSFPEIDAREWKRAS